LVDHFLADSAKALKKRKPTPPKELYTLLETYSFPGNIRELQAMTFDAVSRHKSRLLSLDVFIKHIAREDESLNSEIPSDQDDEDDALVTFSRKLPTIKQATKLLVFEALKRSNDTQSIAARLLGISHQALSKRLKSYNEDKK